MFTKWGDILHYLARVQQAINYIELNLDKNITIKDIAKEAYCSVPHFYRLFQIAVGGSVMNYVRIRKLCKAGYELLTTDRRVIDIALNYGFSTEEAFCRSFNQIFGLTPGRFRKTGKVDDLFTKIEFNNHELIIKKEEDVDMEPNIINKTFRLIGVEKEINFSKSFVETLEYLQKHLRDNIDKLKTITKPDTYVGYWYYKITDESEEPKIFYYASYELKDDYVQEPEGFIIKELPDSKYAVFEEEYRGQIAGPDGYAGKVWFPQSGAEPNCDIPGDFEFYEDRSNLSPDAKCYIYIPIK